MKKYIIAALSMVVVIFIATTSCDSNIKKSEKQNESGDIVGKISDNNSSTATLSVSMDEVSKLMQEHNRLTLERFNYTYTRAWIEVIETGQNKYDYYLGVEASLESKTNERAYSCYSVFTQLEIDNAELHFYKDAIQRSCTGKCCGNCKLVLTNDNLGCECYSPSENTECSGKGDCKYKESEVLTKEQEKNDMI
ncbi:MAG: hypothetical protein QM503_02215 [Bacteroidota bacterium]